MIVCKTALQPMRNFLLAALLLVAAPVNAGDLGIFDVWMPGTQPKKAMTRSTSFEIIGSKVSFKNDLLEISISEKTIASAKKYHWLYSGELASQVIGDYSISRDQVISFDWQIQAVRGQIFYLYYRTKSQGRSVAAFPVKDADEARAFKSAFIEWMSR